MAPLFENGEVEKRLAASLGDFSATRIRVDVGDHPTIENGFSILPAIVDAIQTDDGSFQIKANSLGDARDLRQGLLQQRRLIAITWGRNKGCDHT